MLLSRFWIFVLAVAAGMGIAVAMIATRLSDDQVRDQTVVELARDRLELEMMLKLDARTRIDAIGPIAANGDVRAALREANARAAGTPVPEAARTRLTTRLGELNSQLGEMAGDLVFAVDQSGIIVASIGVQGAPAGAGIGAFPLVSRALAGYVRDDVWLWNGELYRMAARPVIEGGQYAGAIVHGKRIDDLFASRLVARLSGATVGFFVRSAVVGSAMPSDVPGSPRRDDLSGPLERVLAGSLARGDVSEPEELPTGGVAIYAPLVGAAAYAQAGYVLARPVVLIGSPVTLIESASSADWTAALPLTGGVTLALFLLGMLFVWIERDRPLGRFRRAAEAVGKREVDRFQVQDFGGQFRKAASALNDALDKLQEQAGRVKKKAADLDAILGEAPAPATASFFGFAGDANSPEALASIPSAASVPQAPARPAAPSPAAPPPPAPPGQGAAPPAPPRPPAPPPPMAPPMARPMAASPPTTSSPTPVVPPPAEPATTPAVKPPTPLDEDDGDDGATMVSRVPDELIKQSATGAFPAAVSDEEAHFQDVYKQFVATKQQCGEPTAGLSFERFKETLHKNQEKIRQAHGTSKVRFTVYVKEGRAALKATPIK